MYVGKEKTVSSISTKRKIFSDNLICYGEYGIFALLKFIQNNSFLWFCIKGKEIVERRHEEPIKFLFLPKMGLLGSQASTEKKMVVNSEQLFRAVFSCLLWSNVRVKSIWTHSAPGTTTLYCSFQYQICWRNVYFWSYLPSKYVQ